VVNRKNIFKPKTAFLIALLINILLFGVSWEPVVQAKAGSPALYVLYSLLYIVGAYSFYWSYQISKQAKSGRWQSVSLIGVIVAIAWICFLIFALTIGYFWAKAWEQSNWQF
jgi:hypothetical protein